MTLLGAMVADLPVTAFFTSRTGGVSAPPYSELNLATHVGDTAAAVRRNRAIVSEYAGAPVTFLNAAHGIDVARVTAGAVTALPFADILVTTVPGVALGAIAADCAPVLLHDAATGAVAAVHCGREGLYAGVIEEGVGALTELRPRPSSNSLLSASIGPAICGQCYEVPEQLQVRVATRHPAAASVTRAGTSALDIPHAIAVRLGELGVGSVTGGATCTREDPRYFSHRRDGVTGRHAGVVVCGDAKVPFVPPNI